jgi:uncharacterized protein
MIQWLALFLIAFAACSQASGVQKPGPQATTPCSDSWYRSIEEKIATSDAQGHGPDIGSDEWKSVVEFKLGIRGKPNLPERDSEAWCSHVDQIVWASRMSSKSDGDPEEAASAGGPSYDCEKAGAGSVEALICEDKELSALDLKLSDVYAAASQKASNEHPPVLKVEQRGWIKGRNDCWKSDDRRGCVRDEYKVRFLCDGNPANEVVTIVFQTDPPTLIAERGDSVSLMYLQPSGSGAKYQGRNETFWEHQGEALITWGYGAREMRCKQVP